MKKIFYLLFVFLITILVYYNKNDLYEVIFNQKDNYKDISEIINNNYSRKQNYNYIKLTDKLIVESKQDILNVIYTILDTGMTNFTFYCHVDYVECMNEVDNVSKDRVTLSHINNYVHPYNSFSDIETTRYPSSGKVAIQVNHSYDNEMITKIDNKVDQIIEDNIKDDMNDRDKIKIIHDYIIDKTKYDTLRSDGNISTYKSDSAYGPLFEGYAICNGYSDLMNIFLHKFNIDSFKIASENHIWNLVKLDNMWYHLDLTWDDPVMENGKDIIDYSYFLISDQELLELKDNQHFYDKEIYIEAKQNI